MTYEQAVGRQQLRGSDLVLVVQFPDRVRLHRRDGLHFDTTLRWWRGNYRTIGPALCQPSEGE